jgi:hypothetical protein
MNNYNNKHLIFIVYDGVKNSVFQSQVLHPILDGFKNNELSAATIISFEPNIKNAEIFCTTLSTNPNLKFKFFKRLPFFGRLSLLPAIYSLRSFLKKNKSVQMDSTSSPRTDLFSTAHPEPVEGSIERFQKMPDQITARGPLAGYILCKAKPPNTNILIQARGLCAEEYRYTKHKAHRNFLQKLWDKFTFSSLENIEHTVYGNKSIKIEAVSLALKDYLVTALDAESANIFIAVKDIPKSIDKYQAVVWRGQVRDELGISDDAIVYCYSGSFRPWQCAKETVESFAFEYFKNSKAFMLVLTQDIEPFKKELEKFNIPVINYKILTVKPLELYKYLCAANFGMLLRESDVINWVSRPTKMLEYQACGLKIIHNNTVAWLTKSS